MPETSNPLEELNQLLIDLPWENEALLLSGVDGLIAGVLVLPEAIPNDEWLPLVWNSEEPAFPDDPALSERLTELVLDYKTVVVGELLKKGLVYQPVIDVFEQTDEILWETWVEGFERAVSLRKPAFEAMMDSSDVAISAAATGLALLMDVANREKMPRRQREEIIEDAPDMIPAMIGLLYRKQRGLPLTPGI